MSFLKHVPKAQKQICARARPFIKLAHVVSIALCATGSLSGCIFVQAVDAGLQKGARVMNMPPEEYQAWLDARDSRLARQGLSCGNGECTWFVPQATKKLVQPFEVRGYEH